MEDYARFDHALYWQTPEWRVGGPFSLLRGSVFHMSDEPAEQFMDVARTQGIVAAGATIQKQRLEGMSANRDIFVGQEM